MEYQLRPCLEIDFNKCVHRVEIGLKNGRVFQHKTERSFQSVENIDFSIRQPGDYFNTHQTHKPQSTTATAAAAAATGGVCVSVAFASLPPTGEGSKEGDRKNIHRHIHRHTHNNRPSVATKAEQKQLLSHTN